MQKLLAFDSVLNLFILYQEEMILYVIQKYSLPQEHTEHRATVFQKGSRFNAK